jgi:hypothetical protein
MKKITKGLIIVCFLVFASQGIFAQNSDFAIMGKAWGGLNTWLTGAFGAPMLGNYDDGVKIKAYGFSFGGELLFLDPEGFQIGIGIASLPMMTMNIKETDDNGDWINIKASLNLIPLTADLVFNSRNIYTNVGLGIGFMKLNSKITSNSELDTFGDISTVFLIKAGSGYNISVWQNLAIDFGASVYIPFSTQFDEMNEYLNPILTALILSQWNVRLGVSYYF